MSDNKDAPSRRDVMTGWLIVAAAFAGLVTCSGEELTPEQQQARQEQAKLRDEATQRRREAELVIIRGERRVRDVLREPDSAEFRGVFEGNDGVVCGEVNARNGFGGMNGFQPFVSARNVLIYEPSKDAAAFAAVWELHCSKTTKPDGG
jgi:hypothetical protein